MNNTRRGLGSHLGFGRKRALEMGSRFAGRSRGRGYGFRYLDDVSVQDLSYYDMVGGRRPLRLHDGSCRFFDFDRDGIGRNYYRRRDLVDQINRAIKERDAKKEER